MLPRGVGTAVKIKYSDLKLEDEEVESIRGFKSSKAQVLSSSSITLTQTASHQLNTHISHLPIFSFYKIDFPTQTLKMKFTTSAVLLAGATSVLAGPAVLPRAITGPTRGYICDGIQPFLE